MVTTMRLRQADRLEAAIGKRFVLPPGAAARDLSVTEDALVDFALSTGDLNPLYVDLAVASASRSGALVPPLMWYSKVVQPNLGVGALTKSTWAASVDYPDGAPPPPGTDHDTGEPDFWIDGLRALNRSTGFTFRRAPRFGEPISISGQVTSVQHKISRRLGPMAIVTAETEYAALSGDVLVAGEGSSFVYDIEGVASSYAGPTTPPQGESTRTRDVVSPLKAMSSAVLRGEQPRYWDDVSIGEQLPDLFKGTLDHTEIACFSVREGVDPRADELIREARRLLRAGEGLEAAALYRRVAGTPEFGFGVERHLDTAQARTEGMPGAYDIGLNRAAWAVQAVTNWMGYDGILLQLDVELRGAVIVSDSLWCRGVVDRREVRDGRHVVGVELFVENQRGDRVAKGSAVVSLPAR